MSIPASRAAFIALAIGAHAATASADVVQATSPDAAASRFDLGLSIGTVGASAQLSMQMLAQAVALRVIANEFDYHHDTSTDGADYRGKLKLRSQSLLIDWLPFAGRFHLSAGVVRNDNSLRLDGKPSGPDGTYQINGHTYTSAQVGTLTARVDFRKTAPYLGLGWGSSAASGLHFIGDIGVIGQGKAKAYVTDTGGSVGAADLQQTQSDLQDKLDSIRWYPLVQFGLGYRF